MSVEIRLAQKQHDHVANLVASGRFSSVEEAIAEAIDMLVATERLKNEVQVGIQQADQNDVHEHAAVFDSLRSRLTATDE